jgi:HPt (histidine-containing phosphotransfer) domain-containing protein|tara:strand:- start:772 stop:1110 length:339 start_codon:yes stop_codon:yes gene_type:complete
MDKHYSIKSLNEIAGDDLEFMTIVAKTFLEEIPPDLKSMVEAFENDNKQLAYQFAHKMKPNLEMFGISLKKEITAIESWSKSSKNKEALAGHLETISSTLEEVFKELKEDFR